jgi:hypothetical protein
MRCGAKLFYKRSLHQTDHFIQGNTKHPQIRIDPALYLIWQYSYFVGSVFPYHVRARDEVEGFYLIIIGLLTE